MSGSIDLQASLDEIRRAPANAGTVELIVLRPAVDEREIVEEALIDPVEGVVGDSWRTRVGHEAPDPRRQVTLVGARLLGAITGDRQWWAQSGDQLVVDLDLSVANVPPGTRLEVGEAVLEVTDEPHRGCRKFAARFGIDALRLVNSDVGKELNLRGVNARVVRGGAVRRGDTITKVLAD